MQPAAASLAARRWLYLTKVKSDQDERAEELSMMMLVYIYSYCRDFQDDDATYLELELHIFVKNWTLTFKSDERLTVIPTAIGRGNRWRICSPTMR